MDFKSSISLIAEGEKTMV
jgi:hypothetical protein